jgi:hypothetical protein
MVKVLKKGNGKFGNELEFYTTSLEDSIHEAGHVVVRDCDCQMERTYYVGLTQELDDFEPVKIESIEQVIKAWLTGSVWF